MEYWLPINLFSFSWRAIVLAAGNYFGVFWYAQQHFIPSLPSLIISRLVNKALDGINNDYKISALLPKTDEHAHRNWASIRTSNGANLGVSQLPAFEVETSEILWGLSRTWLKKLLVRLIIYLENYISTFYGNYFDSPKDFNVSVFDDLDLGEFFLSTRPEVVILRCQVNSWHGTKF